MKKNKIKSDISSNWEKSTFVPKYGEIVLYVDLQRTKIGDGVHKLNDLPFTQKDFEGTFYLEEGE